MTTLKLLATLAVLAVLLSACAAIPPAVQPAQPPTEQPAQAPTQAPAESPTQAPAESPTQAPAESPTEAPTLVPTPAQVLLSTNVPPAQVVGLDTQGLPDSWQQNVIPATPYDESQPPGPTGMPEHTQIKPPVTDPKDKQPGDPIMYIIPVGAYEKLWDDAGNPYVASTITKVYSSTVALQSPPPTSGMAALPPEEITGVNDVAVQIGRAVSEPESASKSGYRFVGRWAQDANPVTADSRLFYTYQGFTNDGRYLVSFFYPVTTGSLVKQSEMSAESMAQFNSDPQGYIAAQAAMLNKLSPADWKPNLTQLDTLVGSLRIEGMLATGLHDIVWQWLGTSWYEQSGTVFKTNPIADPTLYHVIYRPIGILEVKADCNNASGTYTYEGGMVGSVRVQMGPTTLAMCAADSRSQELINSLMAAQDFRVQPAGAQMQLNMPAGGPVLHFQNAGPAPK